MSSENRALWAEVRKLETRVRVLEGLPVTSSQQYTWTEFVEDAFAKAAQRHRQQFSYGTRVRWRFHRPNRIVYSDWTGRVIPRPFNAKQFGKDGDEFIHIMTDDGHVRSCYPWNLEVV